MGPAALRSLAFWALTVLGVIAAEVKDGPIGPAFSCRGRSPGYYADLETNCQDYHMCDAGGRRYTYSCPNQTRFQQRVMICDHWFLVDCSLAESHFDANLLIGQKDKHFVGQQFPKDEDRDRDSAESFRGPPAPPRRVSSPGQPKTTSDGKKSFLTSPAKKETPRYPETKFSTPTGAIKPTTERTLPSEFAGNPFFSGLTQVPSTAAGKGERGSVTFHQRRDQEATPPGGGGGGQTPRATPPPPPARSFTPPLRNPPTFPNQPSAAPTPATPPTFARGFVTREGTTSPPAQRTEPPRLFRNDFSKVIEITSFGAFTTESPLTSQRQLPTTRVGVDLREPLPLTRAPPTPSLAPPVWEPLSASLVSPNRTQAHTPVYEVGFRPSNVSQGQAGLLRTAGGFRYVTVNTPDHRPAPFGAQGRPTAPTDKVTSTFEGAARETPSTIFGVTTEKGNPTGDSTGNDFPSGTGIFTGKGVLSSVGFRPTTRKDFSTGTDGFTGKGFTSAEDFASEKRFPTGSDVSSEGHGFSGFGSGFSTGTGGDVPTGSGDISGGFTGGQGGALEEEEDLNTVEVRIPDPRRMFFIPEDAASEAEMLQSQDERVLRIALPSARHHGPMRFKGPRAARGRPDCPQCHPAFLAPGSCQPCVLIRR